MKQKKNVFKRGFLLLAGILLFSPMGKATVDADVLGDPCTFNAVQIEQSGGAPDWFHEKEGRCSTVNLNFAVQESDWSEATALRVRIQSLNNGEYLPTDATDNNIALKIGAKSMNGDEILWNVNKPYSNVKYVYPNGEPGPNLYFILTTIPYFVVPREYTGCVEFALDNTTFERKTYETQDKIWYTQTAADAQLDMREVKYVSIMLEPENYDDMVMNFGDVQINVNGQWKTVVDMSQAQVVEKSENQNWKEALLSMTANQVLLDPDDTDKTTDVDKSSYTLRKMQATPCLDHVDLAGNGVCDRCFKVLPHEMWDIDEDGFCDDCSAQYCQPHEDENNDNLCDICGHIIDASVTNDSSGGESGTGGSKEGCRSSVIGTAAFGVLIIAMYIIKKINKGDEA